VPGSRRSGGKGYVCTLVPAVCSERSIGIAFQRAIVAADIYEIFCYVINVERGRVQRLDSTNYH
jgi:hypothetical protein